MKFIISRLFKVTLEQEQILHTVHQTESMVQLKHTYGIAQMVQVETAEEKCHTGATPMSCLKELPLAQKMKITPDP